MLKISGSNKKSISAILISFVLSIVLLCTGTAKSQESKIERIPNVVLITISSLRADHVGILGYTRNTTPYFDQFAKTNILFTHAFATSGWMMPAHGSIFTSLYPHKHGATHIDRKLSGSCLTLADVLKENGFYCAGFCCNPRIDEEYGFAQGFDLFDDYSVLIMLESLLIENNEPIDINRQRTNALINDAAIGWLQNNTHKPFFLFVHYYDNHWDYLPPPPYDRLYDPNYEGSIDGTNISKEPLYSNTPSKRDIEHIIALYDGQVKQTDNDLGQMLEFLNKTGVTENSIIIIMGDHGEQFYEHGHTSHQGLYEELIHVPMAISIPDKQAKGKVIKSLVSQMDIMPTILDYLGINTPETCLGISLKPLILGQAASVRDYIFAEYTGGAVPDCYIVRSSHYKYFQAGKDSFVYDLFEGSGELHALPDRALPAEIASLKEYMEQVIGNKSKNWP